MRATFLAAHGRGWQVCAHVTGDAGVDAVLDAFDAANHERPIGDPAVHAASMPTSPMPGRGQRAAALGVIVDTQPAWYYKDADVLGEVLGEARAERSSGCGSGWTRAFAWC